MAFALLRRALCAGPPILIAVLAAPAVAAGPPAPAAASQQAWCPDVRFLGARGSGQPYERASRGLGTEVHYMASIVRKRLREEGETVQLSSVPYEAVGVEVLFPSKAQLAGLADPRTRGMALRAWYRTRFKRFIASIDQGIAAAADNVIAFVRNCPDSDIIMAGYSQGAMVVHQAQLRLHDEAREDELFAIIGTLLLADGDLSATSAAHAVGTAFAKNHQPSGVRTYGRHNDGRDVVDPELTVNICDRRDMVCDFNARRLVPDHWKVAKSTHTGYSSATLKEATTWLLDELLADDDIGVAAAGAVRDCGQVGFAEGTDWVAYDIRATRTSCKTARAVARAVKGQSGDYTARRFRCRMTGYEPGGAAASLYRCTRVGRRVVTFRYM